METQNLIDEAQEDMVDIQEILDNALGKLNTVEKLEILMTILNFTSKTIALYLVYVHFETVFYQNTLLLFSYLLYALLELVAFAAAIAFVVLAKIVKIVLQINTYYLDNFVCLPILYAIFKFCFIVTFLVQSITLILFARFSNWMFPILLAASLFVILGLQISRMILILGGKFGIISKYIDTTWIFQKLAPKKLSQSYSIARSVIDQAINIYEKINPRYKEYVEQAYHYHQKAVEMKENVDWVKSQIGNSAVKIQQDIESESQAMVQEFSSNNNNKLSISLKQQQQ